MRRLFLVPLVLSLTLLAAACGGGSSNSDSGSGGTASGDDAAVVNGDHITQATLDRRLNEAACSYKLQKKTFPKAGTTEYQQIRTQIRALVALDLSMIDPLTFGWRQPEGIARMRDLLADAFRMVSADE